MNHKNNDTESLRRQWWRAGVILAVLVVLVLAVAVTPRVLDARAQGGDVLRIGYLGPAGTETANGAQLAIDQINSFGGVTAADGTVYRLELVTLVDAPGATAMGDAVAELAAQGVVAVLGPDTNAQITPDSIQALVDAGLPVLTPVTGDALTDMDTANIIFRTRAPERVLSFAIGSYLTGDLGLTTIAVVQTEVEFTEAMLNFENVLANLGIPLIDKIQVPPGSQLIEESQRLLSQDPAAIVMWGGFQDAARLLGQLRDNGWAGVFAYRTADEAARAGILPDELANGVLGMNAWSYAEPADASRIFLRDYVVAYGEVPGPRAVAAYDALWYLRTVLINEGATPTAIQVGLFGGGPQTLVQGVLHPLEFGNGDLARVAVIYELGPHGGPSVVARFDDTTRLQVGQPGPVVEEETPIPPTATSSLPTATLEGTWVRVTANVLNVRTGPGFDYDKIGQVSAGDLFRVLGASADYAWMVIDFQGGVGWVKTEFVEVLGDLGSVTVIQPPPSPTAASTPTPTLSPNPDIVIDTVVLSPTQPVPGKPFTATVTVRNTGGGAAGRFAVAATWEPGAVYTAGFIEGLAAGQSVQLQLSGTLAGTGVFQVGVVADLNKEVPEFNEDNNVYNVTYRADYPLFANQSSVQISVGSMWDLYGGTPDFKWDGYNIELHNGAQIGQLSGVTYENVHYDMLAPGVVTYDLVGFGVGKVMTGAVFAFITAEGQRAVMRVDNMQSGGPIWLSYRVYNNTP